MRPEDRTLPGHEPAPHRTNPAATMNIMFRKHFHADKEPGYGFGKAGGRAARNKGHGAHGKRARDAGYSSLAMPDSERGDRGAGFYRTHLFLNPSGACQSCGGAVDEELSPGAGLPPPPAAAPPAPRRPSVTLIKWPSTKRKSSGGGSAMGGRFDSLDVSPGAGGPPGTGPGAGAGPPTPTASAPPSRQVSFNKSGQQQQQQARGRAGPGPLAATTSLPMSRSEPVSLANLDRDCFIIPLHAVDRFLPEGVPMPEPSQLGAAAGAGQQQALQGANGGVKVLEVSDPLLSVLLHLMTPLEPLEPLLESPLASPHRQQGAAAADLVQEVSRGNAAVRGMLLTNMEKNSEFPYISYYVINSAQTDPKEFFRSLRSASLRKFDPRNIRYTASHTLDLFNEVATIARPPFDPGYPSAARRAAPASTGYIVSFYKVFEGDDGRRFEKNWLYWTGARMLYRYLPRSVGLRRITLHKSISQGDKLYLLLVECANFLEDLSAAAVLIPALRARLCGYTGIYRAVPLPAAATPS
ncbi:Triple functional domain protein [Frankliniella fusca]|uniref:Triple functional domain protein n=1 Tax=Frankliniella fusca TaxID=407009 RepID=A0AAE1GR62_9NEOP|nr:Triple functional domain protein [Frankliniella fusca]